MSLLFTVMGTAVDSELSPGCDRDSALLPLPGFAQSGESRLSLESSVPVYRGAPWVAELQPQS